MRDLPLWLVWSNEHKAWWGPNGCGYYVDVNSAGRYSYEEAVDICNGRDFPWPPTVRHDLNGHEQWPENPPELVVPAPEFWEALNASKE